MASKRDRLLEKPPAPRGHADRNGAKTGISVVLPGICTRTQNGHIRNDTRDASRRIREASLGPICRKNCAASDRTCTRVTL
jgi:hypothetical protein